MEDFTDLLQDIDGFLRQAQQGVSPSAVTPAAENALKKAEAGIAKAKQMLNGLMAVDRAQAQDKLRVRQNAFAQVSQQASLARVATIQAPSYEQQVAGKVLQSKNYALDAQRNVAEANETGMRIVDSLDSQNKQMKQIQEKSSNVQVNTQVGGKLLDQMRRKEKGLNFLLYMACLVFLGLDALCFWVYHHDVPPPAPEPSE